MRFSYEGKDQSGKKVKGAVEANSQEEAVRVLQRNEVIPIRVEKEKKAGAIMRELQRMYQGVSKKELVIFFRQLATLVSAKVGVLNAVRVIGEQSENIYFRSVLKDVGDDVEDGMSLSEALAKHPLAFDHLTTNIIASGEVSGNLQRSIEYTATSIEENYKLTSQIKSALLYPSVVIVVAMFGGIGILGFIVPKISEVIIDLEVEIPWYTQAVISIGDFMKSFWWLFILFLILIGIMVWYYVNTDEGKQEWDVFRLKLPLVGELSRYIYLARFADNLSILIKGGIPLIKALMIVSSVVGNVVYQDIIQQSANDVRKGGKMTTAFRRAREIPGIVTQMIEVGEETGKLSETLESISKFYKQESDTMSRNMTALIEPFMIVILGVGIGGLVFAILMPIYNIAGQF